jgi:hypothetical protein
MVERFWHRLAVIHRGAANNLFLVAIPSLLPPSAVTFTLHLAFIALMAARRPQQSHQEMTGL